MTFHFNKTRLYQFLNKHGKTLQQLMLLLLCYFAFNSVLYDLQHYVSMPADLRNRIVGARMLKDGLSPYFYEWHSGDTVRYYNLMGFLVKGNIHTSSATSTPFVHLLMRPLAELNQMQFNIAWLLFEYASLIGCAWVTYKRLGKMHGLTIAAVTIFFTYTSGWRHHVFAGQLYIVLALLSSLSWYFFTGRRTVLYITAAAFFGVISILIRPVFALFFLPFIFRYKKYRPYAAAMSVLFSLWVIYAWFNPVQKLNWQEYFQLAALHSEMHLQGVHELQGDTALTQFEGISYTKDAYQKAAKPIMEGQENSAFYIILLRLGYRWSMNQLLLTGSLLVILLLLPLIRLSKKKITLTPEKLCVLGFCAFYIFEFFMPVARFTYYFSIWLFPLLLFFVLNKRSYLFLLAAAGFILNITIIPAIKLEHTIGQFFMLFALLLFVYDYKTVTKDQ